MKYLVNFYFMFKASIIGCGSVGATTAYSFLLGGIVTDLALIDLDSSKANGLKLDLEHATSFCHKINILAGDDYSLIKNSDVVIVCAGARQQEGETRLDLIKKNKSIFNVIIPNITKNAPDSILIIVTNPVDILTRHSIDLSGFDPSKVFGTGTVLDSIRLQFHISEKIAVSPKSIDAYVLGEHGDSSFPLFSSANVLGKSLVDFDGFTKQVADECYEMTKNAAYRIINDQGYTCYSIATVVKEIVQCIFEDNKQVFTLSVPLHGYYDVSDVCLSVPCVLGRGGVEQVLKVPLSKEEQEQFKTSSERLKPFLN